MEPVLRAPCGFCLLLFLLSMSVCLRFVASSGSNTEGAEEKLSLTDPSNWAAPPLRFVSVEATQDEKDKHKTHLAFTVTHSSQAFVLRERSFDFIKKLIGDPGTYSNGNQSTSRVLISVDSSQCTHNEVTNELVKAFFVFGLVGDKSVTVRASIDICKAGKGKLTEGVVAISSRFLSRDYKIMDKDEILINPGSDPKFYIDFFYPDESTEFVLSTRLWNWGQGRGRGVIEEGVVFSRDETPVSTRYLDLKVSKGNSANLVRAAVTVKIGSEKISGNIKLLSIWRDPSRNQQRLVNLTQVENSVSFRLPYKVSAFPSGLVTGLETVGCTNKDRGPNSTKCIIQCQAVGEDIKSIFIIKRGFYIPTVQFVSYVVNGKDAFSQIDMGPGRESNDGEYMCVAVTESGKIKTRLSTVQTYGFAKVLSLTLEERVNSYDERERRSAVQCKAYGYQPLKMRMILLDDSKQETSTDIEKKGTHIGFSIVNDVMTYGITINSDRLYFPNRYILCTAPGSRGYDEKLLDLSLHLPWYNRTAPIVLEDGLSLEQLSNGITRISCTATGGEDVDISIISFGVRLDAEPGATRKEQAITDGKSVVFDIPTSRVPELDDWTKIYCKASNDKGSTSRLVYGEGPAGDDIPN